MAAARRKEDAERQKLAQTLAREKQQHLAMKLQSGYRGFISRKNVWSIRHGGRALSLQDMEHGLGVIRSLFHFVQLVHVAVTIGCSRFRQRFWESVQVHPLAEHTRS
jgi:hypothetical protein